MLKFLSTSGKIPIAKEVEGMTIGQRIKNRREFLGLTQEELAFKLGYANRSSVNKIENSREVSLKKIKLYADALDTTVEYLMGWEDAVDEIEMDTLVDMVFEPEIRDFMNEVVMMRNEDESKFEKLKSYMQFLKVGQN